MSYIYCPHCDKKVDYMLDICPYCKGELYGKNPEPYSNDKLESEYNDYVYSIRTTRPLYRLFTFIAVILILVSSYFIFIKFGWVEAPDQYIYIFGAGILLLIVTKILTKHDKRDGRL